MDGPNVSVVVAAHNPGRYLRIALTSVVDQQFRDWELIVVDDGSTQDLRWVDDVDPRIRLVRQSNAGVSAARNRGVELSTGQRVAFLDQDDRWLPTKLGRQVSLHDSGAGFTHTAFSLIDADGAVTGPGYGRESTYRSMMAGDLGVLLSSAVIDRALMPDRPFDPELAKQQDLDLFLRISRGHTLHFVPTVEVEYRLHGTNSSRDYSTAARELMGLYRRERPVAAGQGDVPLATWRAGRRRVRRTYSFQAIDAARASFTRRSPIDTTRHLGHAAALSPTVVAESLAATVHRRLKAGRRTQST